MDERHKTILQRNRTNLVKDLDLSNLYDCLLEKGVFTHDMIDEIKSSGTRRDQARQLVRDLETRGSQAFPLFLESLQETGQHSLLQFLQNGGSLPSIQRSDPPQVVRPAVKFLPVVSPMDVDVQRTKITAVYPMQKPTTTPLTTPSPEKEFLKPNPQLRTRRDSIQSYKMDASPCGHCLIINNMNFEPQCRLSDRKGSNIDCDKLETRFKALNFIVEVRTNLKQRQIKHEFSALSKKDHSQYDCCVVIILSHGAEVSHNRFPGAVYGVDGQFVPVQNITTYLDGQHCPSLQGKPKLFFIQACGGDKKDTGFEVSSDDIEPTISGADDQTDAIPTSSSSDSLSISDEPDASPTLPTQSDMLVSYSTFPGYVSWRLTLSGSWYVETLDRILAENAATHDLVTILTMTFHLFLKHLLHMDGFRLTTTLWFAAACALVTAVSTERAITCDDSYNVHRLSCDTGVIRVQAALYGRADSETCSEGRPPKQVTNTQCSQDGAVDVMRTWCDGKRECELNTNVFRSSDPCVGTYKYLETNFTCFPAIQLVACEHSLAHLDCDLGQVIFVYGADYGRRDTTTCAYKRSGTQVKNTECSNPTSKVAESCNGKNSCTVRASNSVFGDPCVGTYKYLEVSYVCEYPLTRPKQLT